MSIVRWGRSHALLLLLLVQACATRPVDIAEVDSSLQPETSQAEPQNAQNAFAQFPAVRPLRQATDSRTATDMPARSDVSHSPDANAWQHFKLPGKQPTQYSYISTDGRPAVMASAASSASMLRQSVRVEPALLQDIAFSWKVKQLIPGADLTQRETHDSPVRLVLVFEGDRSEFSMRNAMLSELSLTLTGEPMPYATLMYVWCNTCTKDTMYINPRTDRIREIALETGPDHLGQWLDYQRDIQADYLKAFGQAPGALVGVGLMTDTDNTRQSALAWYGPISLTTHLTKQ